MRGRRSTSPCRLESPSTRRLLKRSNKPLTPRRRGNTFPARLQPSRRRQRVTRTGASPAGNPSGGSRPGHSTGRKRAGACRRPAETEALRGVKGKVAPHLNSAENLFRGIVRGTASCQNCTSRIGRRPTEAVPGASGGGRVWGAARTSRPSVRSLRAPPAWGLLMMSDKE